MKHIKTQIELPADPAVVWQHLVDTSSMSSWNPFILSMSGVLEVGKRLQVRVAPMGGKPMAFKPRVTIVEPGHRLEWLGRMGMPGLFDGRHSFTLTPVGEGRTLLVQAETFSGALVPLAGKMLSKTEAGFRAMNAALLARLEASAAEAADPAASQPRDLR